MSLSSGPVYSTSSFRPRYPFHKSSKAYMEEAIVRKRETERQKHEYWNQTSKYFDDCQRKIGKFSNWSSTESFRTSMDAYYKSKRMEERRKTLLVRREKLKQLLENDRIQYQVELKELPLSSKSKSLHELRDEKALLRKKKEEELNKEAEQKMLQHWKLNNPEFRQLQLRRHQEFVQKAWEEQIEEKKKIDEEEQRLREEEIRMEMESKMKQEEQIKEKEMARREQIEQWKEDIARQIQDLKDREQLMKELERRKEREEIEMREMEEFEEKRKRLEEKRKQIDLSHFLKRQHRLKLRARALQIQEELEEDKKLLEGLHKFAEAREEAELKKKQKMKEELDWMQGVLTHQKYEEQQRQKEMDLLFSEEAEKMFSKQEEIWKKEQRARKRLMDNVINGLHEQIMEKLKATDNKVVELKAEREKILSDIETMTNEIERVEKKSMEQRLQFIENLDEQVDEKEAKERKEKERREEERRRWEEKFESDNQMAEKLMKLSMGDSQFVSDFRRRRAKWN